MSLPTNLFIDSPEMHDVSMHQLSQDIESWPEEVVQKLKEVVPDTSGLNPGRAVKLLVEPSGYHTDNDQDQRGANSPHEPLMPSFLGLPGVFTSRFLLPVTACSAAPPPLVRRHLRLGVTTIPREGHIQTSGKFMPESVGCLRAPACQETGVGPFLAS